MNNKKYNLKLTQEEMDNIVYALVLLKVDAMNCLERGSEIRWIIASSWPLHAACLHSVLRRRQDAESPYTV